MGILIVIAMVWLCVRLAAGLRMLTEVLDEATCWPDCQDAPAQGRGAEGADPQDVRSGPQDAIPLDLDTSTSSAREGDPASVVAAAVWREVTEVVRELAARRVALAEALRDDRVATPPTDPRSEWLAALRETIVHTVPRPDGGPACLGGREDDAYLRGWDDALDWVSQGRDAEPPTWGGVAYMTGWNDAVRDIGRARRSAAAWPTLGVTVST